MTNQSKGRVMNGSCRKCGGLMIVERVLDYYGPLTPLKCVNCGCRWDAQATLHASRYVQANHSCEGKTR